MRKHLASHRICLALASVLASTSLAACASEGAPAPTETSGTATIATRSSKAATIIIGTSDCGVIDSNANCVATPFTAIVTQSTPDIEIERYSADGVFNDTGHAVVFTFADFGPPFGFCVSEVTGALTEDGVETLSPSGHASIVCRFRS